MILAYETRVIGRLAQSSMGLLPIVPILLLPFILIFFVVVFPIWAVALAVLGIVLLMIKGLKWLANRAGSHALDGAYEGLQSVFHWVLTFGGFTEKMKRASERMKQT